MLFCGLKKGLTPKIYNLIMLCFVLINSVLFRTDVFGSRHYHHLLLGCLSSGGNGNSMMISCVVKLLLLLLLFVRISVVARLHDRKTYKFIILTFRRLNLDLSNRQDLGVSNQNALRSVCSPRLTAHV